MNEKRYSVWVGSVEANDFLLTKDEAETLADAWRNDGYDDVSIYEYTDEEIAALPEVIDTFPTLNWNGYHNPGTLA